MSDIKDAYAHKSLYALLHSLLTDITNIRTRQAANLKGTATYDAASLADGVGATGTVTVTGAALGDFAEVSFGVDLQGITCTAYVSAANTVAFRLQNESGGTLDLASTTVTAVVKPNTTNGVAPTALVTTDTGTGL